MGKKFSSYKRVTVGQLLWVKVGVSGTWEMEMGQQNQRGHYAQLINWKPASKRSKQL